MTEIEFASTDIELTYPRTRYKGQQFYAHRIQYIRQYGEIPQGYTVTKSLTLKSNRTTGENITKDSTGKWRVQVKRNGTYIWLGRFRTYEAAKKTLDNFNMGYNASHDIPDTLAPIQLLEAKKPSE